MWDYINDYSGVFMRDNPLKCGSNSNESAVVNLDNINGRGTHWVEYSKYSGCQLFWGFITTNRTD